MGAPEEIEGEEGLGKEFVPECHGKLWVRAAQYRYKVILEDADGPLGGVAAVDMGGDELVLYFLVVEVVYQCLVALVVQLL